MVEPVQKPTYWDHAALPTEERRARAKRTSLAEHDVVQEQEEGSAMEDDDVTLSAIEAEQHSDLSSNESVDRAGNNVSDVAESQISTQPIPIGTQDSEPPQSQITTQPMPSPLVLRTASPYPFV